LDHPTRCPPPLLNSPLSLTSSSGLFSYCHTILVDISFPRVFVFFKPTLDAQSMPLSLSLFPARLAAVHYF
jgi:hypothetical protein